MQELVKTLTHQHLLVISQFGILETVSPGLETTNLATHLIHTSGTAIPLIQFKTSVMHGTHRLLSVQPLVQEIVERGDQLHQETVLPSMHQSVTLLDLHHQHVSRLLLVMK